MPFLPRNSYYLRVSSSSILPLYVYLDNEHVDWMSDRVLNNVVADLRPKIIPKLRAESDAHMGAGPAPANAKKGTVDVHRGDTYQFAYFLREAEPHSVLIKTRNFVLDTAPSPPPPIRKSKPQAKDKTKRSSTKKRHGSTSRTKKGASGKGKAVRKNNEGDDLDYSPSDSEFSDDHVLQVDGDEDTEMAEGSDSGAPKDMRATNEATTASIDVKVEEDERGLPVPLGAAQKLSHVEDAGTSNETRDDDEEKPKLALELKYRSFSNFNRCLCVVVEPWPPLRRDTRAPSLASPAATGQSSRVPTRSDSRNQREKTPLFLPDLDDSRATPGPSHGRTLPPVPLFDNPQTDRDMEENEDLGDSSAIMQFSQLLNTTGRVTGAIEEDDEFDGAALFADADEAKEL